MLYGLKYGYNLSLEWLVSFMVAFFQSSLITQPIKVMLIAVLITMILKRPIPLDSNKPPVELGTLWFGSKAWENPPIWNISGQLGVLTEKRVPHRIQTYSCRTELSSELIQSSCSSLCYRLCFLSKLYLSVRVSHKVL